MRGLKKRMGYQDSAQNVARQIAKNPSSRKLEKATLTEHRHQISYQNDRAFGHTSPSQVSMPFFGPSRRMNSLSLSSLVVECTGAAPQCPLCFRCLSALYPAREREKVQCFACVLSWIFLPRREVAGTRQASFPQPSSKNQFNIRAAQ